MLVYFARGSLPWQGLKATTHDEKNMRIKDKKLSLSGKRLCEDFLPDEFAEYIDYTRNLGFGDKPDYGYLRKLFRNRFRAERFQYDNIFDWTERRFHEIRGELKQRDPTSQPANTSKQNGGRLPNSRKKMARVQED